MKIFNKYVSWALMSIAGTLLVTSCDDTKNNSDFTVYNGADNAVYFSSRDNNYLTLEADGTSVSYPVYRTSDKGEMKVDLLISPVGEYADPSPYTFPSSVTFAEGQKVSQIVINYDASLAEYDDEQEYEVRVPEEYATPFGLSNVIITLVYPAPWTKLGTGYVGDTFWGVDEDPDAMIEVGYWQNDLYPNRFRIDNPYYVWNGQDTYFEFRILQPGEEVNGVTVTLDNLVYFEPYFAENIEDWGGDVYIFWPGDFYTFGMYTDEASWTSNYVVDYQENGLPGEIHLSPIYMEPNSQTWAGDTGTDESMTLIFPGYDPKDISLSVSFEGILTDPSQQLNVLADVTMGTDLSGAKVGVGAGTDADAIAQGIEDGSVTSVDISSPGNIKIPFDSENESGKYTIVVVGYSGDDVVSTASATFTYVSTSAPDANEGWNSLGYVEYTDGYMCSAYLVEPLTYEVEIQESADMAGLYRLVNPYGEPYPENEPGDYNPALSSYLYINAEDPDHVYIPESEQSLDWGDGALICYSIAGYFLDGGATVEEVEDEGVFGTLKDGLITFPAEALLISFEGDTKWYGANVAVDLEYYSQTGKVDYIYDSEGQLYAPFCVDLTSLSSAASKAKAKVAAKASKDKVNSTKSAKFGKSFEARKAASKKIAKKEAKTHRPVPKGSVSMK